MAKSGLLNACIAAACWGAIVGRLGAAELEEAEDLYRTGKYSECAALSASEIDRGSWEERWHILKVQAELAEGKYGRALETLEQALDANGWNLQLRYLAHQVHLFNGQSDRAAAALERLERYVSADPRRYSEPSERVALGRFLLRRGADPRQVLELVYDRLRKESPDFVDAYFASAELALDKYDNALAAETLRGAPRVAQKDPRYHFLLARAYAPDDPLRTEAALKEALEINPRHVDSLLLRVDRLIDAEEYRAAEEILKQILDVNANHPLAWGYKAVLAHLENDASAERLARDQALTHWKTNPEVDHLIGRKLSEKYRFAEGAEYQRRALAFDADYRPAQLQLSQDLLRLGEETEGWRLADEVSKQDAYDVVAYNLVTLEDELAKFRTIGGDGLMVRMESREAELYGKRVVELLEQARESLCKKYDVQLEQPIVIEIFPHQKDFAVRTFGMPGVAGFLGVCFGRVITANSPASQGDSPSNWEAVLWHEFCHVVTLHKTRNKMPRWLSEGISVFEERQANPAWGQGMNPQYREIILGGKMTPVSQLSSAFLAPPSPMHLQFAYYESSLVVEYLIEQFGMEALKKILNDLGDGMEMNEALIRHTVPLGRLDRDFATFARAQAEALAPSASWDKPDRSLQTDQEALAGWVKENPRNVPGLKQYARQLLRDREYDRALTLAKQLDEVFPEDSGPDNSLVLMAAAYRGLNDVENERSALEKLADRAADAVPAYLRLMELGEKAGAWEAVRLNSQRMLAVNPLVPAPHRYLAQAAEKLGKNAEAIRAYEALLLFDTTDTAETHFRLAQLLRDADDRDAAKRHVLMALEEAPRFLAAHRLLLELTAGERVHESAVPNAGTDVK
jgi:tetratricopeptide (TPR) repeat protein